MQTLEAILSFLFFVWAASLLLFSFEQPSVDDSLYRLQLTEDAWRVLYLRGNFEDFNGQKKAGLESEFGKIGQETGLCIFMDGIRFTNCRGGDEQHSITSSITRTVIHEGKPESYTFSIGSDRLNNQ